MHGYARELRTLRLGIVLTVATMIGGFVLGAVFGALDHRVREWLADRAAHAVEAGMTPGSALPIPAEVRVELAWKYLQRAHLHAPSMASAGLILIAGLALVPAASRWSRMKAWLSAGIGTGAAGYTLFLLLAAYLTPALGEAVLIKESLTWIAMPSAGVYLTSCMGAAVLTARWLYQRDALASRVLELKPGRASARSDERESAARTLRSGLMRAAPKVAGDRP